MKSITVRIEDFPKTDLEKELDHEFGYAPRTVLENVEKTYQKYLQQECTTDIKIICNSIQPQLYKFMNHEIQIIND